jgi:transposase
MSEAGARRIEVIPGTVSGVDGFPGTGRRRSFSRDDKTRIVEETLAAGAVVSEVARQHGLTPAQLFTWRRDARRASAAISAEEAAQFAPAIVDSPTPPPEPTRTPRSRRGGGGTSDIEVEIAGVTVRVGRGADVKMVAAMVRALKAGR